MVALVDHSAPSGMECAVEGGNDEYCEPSFLRTQRRNRKQILDSPLVFLTLVQGSRGSRSHEKGGDTDFSFLYSFQARATASVSAEEEAFGGKQVASRLSYAPWALLRTYLRNTAYLDVHQTC